MITEEKVIEILKENIKQQSFTWDEGFTLTFDVKNTAKRIVGQIDALVRQSEAGVLLAEMGKDFKSLICKVNGVVSPRRHGIKPSNTKFNKLDSYNQEMIMKYLHSK